MATVIIHRGEDGLDTILSDDPSITVLEIDERAPNDRVYRREVEIIDAARRDAIIGTDEIGHADDERHEAITRRILGQPTLTVIKD